MAGEARHKLITEIETVFTSRGFKQVSGEVVSGLKSVETEMQRIAKMPVGEARTAAAGGLQQQFAATRQEAERTLLQRYHADPNYGPEQLRREQSLLARKFNQLNRELQQVHGRDLFPYVPQHRIRQQAGREVGRGLVGTPGLERAEQAAAQSMQELAQDFAGSAAEAQALRAQIREILSVNEDYIVSTALVAVALQRQRAAVAGILSGETEYQRNRALHSQEAKKGRTVMERERAQTEDFGRVEAQLATQLRRNLATIIQARTGSSDYVKATNDVRTARLQERIEIARSANRTGEVARLQGILSAHLLELSNQTREAAQATAGYADKQRRAGELSARDAQFRAEGRQRVTDTPEARRAAATRRLTLQGYELRDPELQAINAAYKQNRRLILNLEKRQLLDSAAGRAAIEEGVRLSEEINDIRARVRDDIRNTPAARQFRTEGGIRREQAIRAADRDNPRLVQLQAELVILQRERNNRTRAQLLLTEQGRALLREEGRIQAEINAQKRLGADAVRERIAHERRMEARGGAPPGRFEQLQMGLQGPGFAQALGRRFITTGQFALSAVTFRSIVQGISSVVREAEQLQRTFNLIESQFESIGQGDEFAGFREQILGIARDTGISADQVATVGFQIKGVFGEDTQRAIRETRAAIRAALVTGLPQKEIVDSLTAASLAYGTSIDTISDKAIGVEERFGVLAKESIKFFGDISDTAASTGLDLNQLGAVVGVLQRDLGIAGSALSEQFSRVLGTVTDNTAMIVEIFARYPQLQEEGGLARLDEALPKGSGAVLFELAAGFDKLSNSQRQAIAYQLGGSRQFRVVKTVLEGLNEEIAKGTHLQDDRGKALERERNLQETVAIQMDRLRESVRQFGDALFEAGVGDALVSLLRAMGGIAEAVGGVLRVFGSLNDLTRGWLGTVLLVGAAFVAIRQTLRTIQLIQAASRLASARMFGEGALGAAVGGGVPRAGIGAFLRRTPIPGPAGPLAGGAYGPPVPRAPGLGAGLAGTLRAAGPTLALIGVGMFASYVQAAQDRERQLIEDFRSKLESGDEKARREVERRAKRNASVGDRFRAASENYGLKALKYTGQFLLGWAGVRTTETLDTPDVLAQRELDRARRAEVGAGTANMLRAMRKLQVTRERPEGGLLGGYLAGRQGADDLRPLAAQTFQVPYEEILGGYVKQVFGEKKSLDDLISDLESGDEEAFNKAVDLLKLVNRDPEFQQQRPEYVKVLADIQAIAENATAVQDIKLTVDAAQRLYQMGRMTRTEFTRVVNDNLAILRDRVEVFKRQGISVPPDLLEALDNAQRTADDLVRSAREEGFRLYESQVGLSKSRTQDPQKLAGFDVNLAQRRLTDARAAYNEAVAKAGGSTDTPEVQAALAAINDAEAGVNEANRGRQRANDEEADARLNLDRVRAGGAKNELTMARRAKEDADIALKRARDQGLGAAAELRAQAAQIEADRSIDDALFNITRARTGVLIAMANAAGREAQAAELGVRDIQAQIRRQREIDPTDTFALETLRGQLVTAQATASAARVSQTRELIDFQLEMNEITVGQAIAQLTALLASPDVQANEDRVREIRLAIKSLKERTANELAFNIGELRLPTLYEVRRLGATQAAGTGYSDNRQVSITINVNNQGEFDDAVQVFTAAVNAPSRYGTAPRVYPSGALN